MSDIATAYQAYAVGCLRARSFGPDVIEYMERIESTFEPLGGQWVVHGAQSEVLEGQWSADVVIIGFPSLEAARAWYRSAAYQEILELRAAHFESQVFLLEGVPPGYRAADTIATMVGD